MSHPSDSIAAAISFSVGVRSDLESEICMTSPLWPVTEHECAWAERCVEATKVLNYAELCGFP